MFPKSLLAGASALVLALPAPASAGSDGLVGGATPKQPRAQLRYVTPRRTTRARATSRAPAVSNAQRQGNREVPTAIDYVGFDAGSPDGVLVRRTTAAMSSMEAVLAMPADGTLTSFERGVLLGAHARATSGNPETARLISTSPLGARAALKAQHDMMTGASSDPPAEQLLERAGFVQLAELNGGGSNDDILDTSYAGSSFWCSASACKTLVFVSTPQGHARNDLLAHAPHGRDLLLPGRVLPAGGAGRDGDGLGGAAARSSARGPADRRLGTAAPDVRRRSGRGRLTAEPQRLGEPADRHARRLRGGPAGGDADVALAEQFCLARNFAIDPGEQTIAAMPGTTMSDVKARWGGLGDAMCVRLATLPAKPAAEVVSDMAAFAGTTGMAPDQLRTTVTLCLSAGYADDDIDAAFGSAMLLVAMGSAPYAELVAQHLHSGIGTTKRPDLVRGWFDAAFDALRGGAQPVFAPNQTGRTDLLIWAAGGQAADAALPAQPVSATLPTFAAPVVQSK